jgi:uncharacterized membrane protein
MGGHHSHSHAHVATDADADESTPFVASRRLVVILLVVLVPILVATVVGLGLLWPHGQPKTADDVTDPSAAGDIVSARVLSATATTCKADSSDRLPDGTIPTTTACASMVTRLSSGPDRGQQVKVPVPVQVYRGGMAPGDGVKLSRYPPPSKSQVKAVRAANPNALANGTVYAWSDFSRGLPLGLLAVFFALLVIGVSRLRGVAALIGLGVAYLAVLRFMLPALRLGENGLAVAVVGSIAVMSVVLYLAHGISAKTTTALLGTIFGILLSGGIAAWACSAAHLNGLGSETNITITQITGTADLSGIIVCGVIVAGLGVLNDVTITQASAVWEVHTYAPHLGVRALFSSGMRVGRDHLASTVYTIAFAYAGAALPTLILIDLYQRPLGQVLTSAEIAEEIVRTLVGSIGLILAIPLTTILAAIIVTSGAKTSGAKTSRARTARVSRADPTAPAVLLGEGTSSHS